MIKLGAHLLLFLHVLAPSFQVILAPCKVETFLTQPHYGTNLAKKELVQIVQIPPVFSQNVMVGKCVNATSEASGAPGTYYVCKQRYSAVEVYIMEHQEVYTQRNIYNGSNPLPIPSEISPETFKSTNFVRDFVVVEAGCEFSFNLLPLLLRQDNTNSYQQPPQYAESQNNRFLKSPFYSKHPDYLPQPEINFPRNPNNPYPAQVTPTTNFQGGNGNIYSGGDRGEDLSANNNNYVPPTNNYSTVNASPSRIKERASQNEDGPSAGSYVSSQKHYSPTKHSEEPDLYSLSDQVGVPIFILSPQRDPLLKNIDPSSYYS